MPLRRTCRKPTTDRSGAINITVRSLLTMAILSTTGLQPLGGQQPVERARVVVDNANLRVAPSLDSGIVRALPKGTIVTVLSHEGSWARIQALAVIGWARWNQLVSFTEPVRDSLSASRAPSKPALGVPVLPGLVPNGRPSSPQNATQPIAPRTQRGQSIALVGGITISGGNFSGSSSGDAFNSRAGFMGGIVLVVPMAGPISLAVEPTFVQKGLAVENTGAKLELSTAYAELPIELRVAVGSRRIGFFLSAGGGAGYEVTCRLARTGVGGTPCADDAAFTNHQRLDFGLVGGAGLHLGPFLIAGRYEMGMRDLYTDSGEPGRNRSLVVYSGVTF
jgi:hypothetical protein